MLSLFMDPYTYWKYLQVSIGVHALESIARKQESLLGAKICSALSNVGYFWSRAPKSNLNINIDCGRRGNHGVESMILNNKNNIFVSSIIITRTFSAKLMFDKDILALIVHNLFFKISNADSF